MKWALIVIMLLLMGCGEFKLKTKWKSHLDQGFKILSCSGDNVYLQSFDSLLCIDIKSGGENWKINAHLDYDLPFNKSGLYILEERNVKVINPLNGRTVDSIITDQNFRKIALLNNQLVLANVEDSILSLYLSPVSEFKKAETFTTKINFHNFNLKVVDLFLYVITDTNIFCLDSKLKPIWNYSGDFDPRIFNASKYFVLTTNVKNVFSGIHGPTFHVREDSSLISPNWISDDIVCTKFRIRKYNKMTGDILWDKKVEANSYPFLYKGIPPVSGDSIYIFINNKVQILNAKDGFFFDEIKLSQAWKFQNSIYYNGKIITSHLDSLFCYQLNRAPIN